MARSLKEFLTQLIFRCARYAALIAAGKQFQITQTDLARYIPGLKYFLPIGQKTQNTGSLDGHTRDGKKEKFPLNV